MNQSENITPSATATTSSREITVNLSNFSYNVQIGSGLLATAGQRIANVAKHQKAAVLADEKIFSLFGPKLIDSLSEAGYSVISKQFPSGETQKTTNTANSLYSCLIEAGLERKSPIIAFGGGVTGDLVGFVAATYQRGVPFVQIPTTVLAMVDASVGGKVGVNHELGKNLIGAFHQPVLVIIDVDVLSTLPKREFISGLAECVKHGLLGDPQLFDWLATDSKKILNGDPQTLIELISRNVEIKARIVEEDEKESAGRAVLNLGHTFGHAIEATSGYGQFLHGEAVALGMCAATYVAEQLNLCPKGLLLKLETLLNSLDLPTKASSLPQAEKLIEAMYRDKKVQDGKLRLVLPTQLGQTNIFDDIPLETVKNAWSYLR